MKSKNAPARFPRKNNRAVVWPHALFGLLVLAPGAEAQEVLMAQPQSFAPPQPLWQQNQTNEFEVFNPEGTKPANEQDEPFKWGPITARPHVLYRFLYASGLPLAPGNQQDTFINEIDPGIAFDIGNHWELDYTPTLRYYSNHQFTDEFDNAVTLTGATAYEDWNFGLSQSYVSSSASLSQTGTQTSQETYATQLTASYAFNSKMSLDMGLYQNLLYTQAFENSYDWSTLEWLNYQFWPRLTIGIGAGIGYTIEDGSPDQTYEQFSGRINWRATDKISFQVNAGFQDRQFLDSSAPDLLSPTFGAAIQYQPAEFTQISLNASRSVTPSYFQGQVTDVTAVDLDLNQRLFGKFYLDLNAGYDMTKYIATTSDISVNREDDSYVFNVRLSHEFLKRGTLAVVYQYNDNCSTAPGFAYLSSQVGIEVGYKF
jgi:hypothetical protein